MGARGLENWREDGVNILFLGDSVTYGGSEIDDSQTFSSLTCANIANWSCHNAGVNACGILNMVARSRYDSRINDASFRIFTFISGDFDRDYKNQIMPTLYFEIPQIISVHYGKLRTLLHQWLIQRGGLERTLIYKIQKY